MMLFHILVDFLRAKMESKSSSVVMSTDLVVLVGNMLYNHRVGRRWTLFDTDGIANILLKGLGDW